MIQNLIIINDGISIFNENFGECHKFNSDPILLSAFFEALLTFSQEFEQGALEQLQFKESYVNYLKKDNLLIIAISDKTDGINIESKLKRITNLFLEKYSHELKNHSIEISQYKAFKNLLLKLGITSNNCGEHTACTECPNHIKTSQTFNEVVKNASLNES